MFSPEDATKLQTLLEIIIEDEFFLPTQDVESMEGIVRDLYKDHVPKDCGECEDVYEITRTKPRCNLIKREEYDGNVLWFFPKPHEACPYKESRKKFSSI